MTRSSAFADVFSPGDEDSDWGFTQFMKLGELQNNAKGWIVDDCIWVEADIKLLNIDRTSYSATFSLRYHTLAHPL